MSGVLVTGGTGKVGAALADILRARGTAVRVGSRRPAPGAYDAVRFDWDDSGTHPAALQGVDRVFLVMPPSTVDPMPLAGPFLAAAERSGVRRVVLLGSAIAFPDAPGRVELEDRVRRRPGGVVLRPSGFMHNFLPPYPLAADIRDRGEIVTAAARGRVGWIDVADVAASGAAVLGHQERDVADDYVLTGPAALDSADTADMIAAASGRPVRVVEVDVDEKAARLSAAGVPAPFATRLAGAELGVREGSADRVTTSVRDLTGRPPRGFAEFAREHADAWRTPGRAGDPSVR